MSEKRTKTAEELALKLHFVQIVQIEREMELTWRREINLAKVGTKKSGEKNREKDEK